jgi:hypothetical protein
VNNQATVRANSVQREVAAIDQVHLAVQPLICAHRTMQATGFTEQPARLRLLSPTGPSLLHPRKHLKKIYATTLYSFPRLSFNPLCWALISNIGLHFQPDLWRSFFFLRIQSSYLSNNTQHKRLKYDTC